VLVPAIAGSQKSVLIVDDSEDNRAVLRTALERLGVRTLEATEARQGVRLAHEHHPHVIILDVESASAEEEGVRLELDAQSRRDDAYLVVLGRSVEYEGSLPKDCIVSKPYHYAPLVRTIERLLAQAK
jgi:CheY-like chemotaxis protein